MPNETTENNQQVQQAVASASSGIEAEIARFEGRNINTNLPTLPNSNREAEKLTQTVNDQQKAAQTQTPPKEGGETRKTTEPPKVADYNRLLGNNLVPSADDKKVSIEKVKEGDNLQQPPATPIDENGKPKRDLTGFGEHEAKLLQQMSNEAFEHFSKHLKESRKLEEDYKTKAKAHEDKIKALETGRQILPESYYENPSAYILSPEFHTMQAGVQLARDVQQHWEEQLVKIEKGEKWQDLINDPKTGQLVYGDEYEVNDDNSARMKVLVTKYLQGAQLQVHNETNKIQQFIGSFTEQHKNYINKIADIERRAMPVFEDEKGAERKFLDETVRPLVKSWGVREDNPAFNLLAKNVALVSMLMTTLRDLTNGTANKDKIASDQQKGGPTNANLGGSSGTVQPTKLPVPTLEDFNKVLAASSRF